MRLIAIKEVKYAGVLRRVGDEFEASDKDAKMIVGFRKARVKEYEARDEKPEQDSDDSPRRGRYKRRDMTPEQP